VLICHTSIIILIINKIAGHIVSLWLNINFKNVKILVLKMEIKTI